ncbi:MAG TPA: MAPEG family protein [Xanthobacteraceae bacterium]|jgi:glutathione S-transferase|nr:MAPEG family protein [Xanthobacteraceae bacterium]
MNASYYPVAIVTLLSALVYFGMAAQVARAHHKTGILAPAMTGDPVLERTIRAQTNTLEWMPIFLPSLWLFAIYWNAVAAAILGAIWIVGRIIYFFGYVAAPTKRRTGFFIQSAAAFTLLLGALGRIIYLAVTGAVS